MWFPIQTATAKVINGFWEIDFPQSNRDQVLRWITVQGPSLSTVNVYLDTIFIDTTPRGDLNRADYFSGIPIARGRQLRLVWNISTGTAPIASIGTDDGGTAGQAALTGNADLFTN